jgi:hypothetical protein
MSRRRKPRYSGALNKPIIQPLGMLYEPGSPFRDSLGRQRLLKLGQLLAHYGIKSEDPGCFQKLAIKLALDWVPGMQVIKEPRARRGAPRKWTLARYREFVETIDRIQGQRGQGVLDAIRSLKKRERLRESVGGLETRYYEGRKRLGQEQLEPPPLSLSEQYERLLISDRPKK